MKRLTTPTHSFTLPFDSSVVSRFLLTYVQNDKIVLEKTGNDMTVDGRTWSVKLTQEETKQFAEGFVSCQIRVLTAGGDSIISEEIVFYVHDVLNEEVLV